MRKIDQHKIKSNEKKQIKLSLYIDSLNSSFTYVSLNNNFELKVRQNRKMVSNGENVKTAIEFIDAMRLRERRNSAQISLQPNQP